MFSEARRVCTGLILRWFLLSFLCPSPPSPCFSLNPLPSSPHYGCHCKILERHIEEKDMLPIDHVHNLRVDFLLQSLLSGLQLIRSRPKRRQVITPNIILCPGVSE